jgi:hypothetical protein
MKERKPRKRTSATSGVALATGGASRIVDAGTVGEALVRSLRKAAAFAAGDQSAPCAILWTDPDRQWAAVIPELKTVLPELYSLGAYESAGRSGPAIWLRCVEARQLEPKVPPSAIPIFYLPGVSRQRLREVEDCPAELQPLVELQFRGTVWIHPNGKDWTPYSFLVSDRGGLGLDVSRDGATAEALQLALATLISERVADLTGTRLDAGFFHKLLAPDLPSALLRWMNNPKETRAGKNENEWIAFAHECVAPYGFDPEKDGELVAAAKLGAREGHWQAVWSRFEEAPHRYQGVVALLEQVDPTVRGTLPFDPEPWPKQNEAEEKKLTSYLSALKDLRPDQAAVKIHDLERLHGIRRKMVWRELGRSQMAVALEPLDQLATSAAMPLAAGTLQEMGELYARNGWLTDDAAMAALACALKAEQESPLEAAVRAVYFQWLDDSARNLQALVQKQPEALVPRLAPLEAIPGRIILFVDGIRFDVARTIEKILRSVGLVVDLAWDWAPFPPVTPTAKPLVSPIASLFSGGDAGDEFAVTITKSGHRWTQERFHGLMKEAGIDLSGCLLFESTDRKGWLEAGMLDSRGHNEGWRMTRTLSQEVQDVASRVRNLLESGWKEVVLVTDHGWLLMPGGFPKAELSKHAVEHRWGRCAAMKESGATDLPLMPWYWNHAVQVATPHGIGCFKAGLEYAHGGLSLQELVIPRMTITTGAANAAGRLDSLKWIGLRCRVTVAGPFAGLRVDLRGRAADAASSKLESRQPKEVSADGTVSLAPQDTADEGAAAVVVLLGSDDQVLDTRPTVIGANL